MWVPFPLHPCQHLLLVVFFCGGYKGSLLKVNEEKYKGNHEGAQVNLEACS
jgi:hypothetical protein